MSLRFEPLDGPSDAGLPVNLLPAQKQALATFRGMFHQVLSDDKPRRVSTVELCKELEQRLSLNDGINEVPRSIINSILNYLEAESLNRLCPTEFIEG